MSLNSSFAVRWPAGPQLLVDVVINPGHEGENCDGDSCQRPEHPDWSPDRDESTSGKERRRGNKTPLPSFLPPRVATQQKPNNRQHEATKFPKGRKQINHLK